MRLLGIVLLALSSLAHADSKISGLGIDFDSPGIKTTVVIFLSARCPCSASHEPAIKELYETYSKKGMQFVAVHSNADESLEISQKHFKESALPFKLIEDSDQKIANAFGALKTPHVYIVQKGEVIFQGGVDDSANAANSKKHFLKDALAAIDQGKQPEVKEARALGCVIKRK